MKKTKAKRGPIIKRDYVLETDTGIYTGPFDSKTDVLEVKLKRLENFMLKSRAIERTWRLV